MPRSGRARNREIVLHGLGRSLTYRAERRTCREHDRRWVPGFHPLHLANEPVPILRERRGLPRLWRHPALARPIHERLSTDAQASILRGVYRQESQAPVVAIAAGGGGIRCGAPGGLRGGRAQGDAVGDGDLPAAEGRWIAWPGGRIPDG